MSTFSIFDISGSAMAAQSKRLNVSASNMANADSVVGPDGQPYRARQVVFQVNSAPGQEIGGVRVSDVMESSDPDRMTEGDDQQDPIADSARAILDGHIVLSRRLAESGHYPAIDIEASISRAMTELIDATHYKKVQSFKQLLSSYQRNRDLVSVGAYAAGSDPLLDKAIRLYPDMERFLQQVIYESSGYEEACDRLSDMFSDSSNMSN